MGDGNRSFGNLDGFQSRLFGTVGHIDNHTDAVHLFYHFAAKSGDTAILLFITAGGQQTLIVVAELHNTHPQLLAESAPF